jgi:hypothetical protein
MIECQILTNPIEILLQDELIIVPSNFGHSHVQTSLVFDI